MTKDDDIIRHLNCAWNQKEQGYTDEAMDEILKALCVMLERDIPRAGERIKSPCLVGKSCKKCLIEDGGCKGFSDDEILSDKEFEDFKYVIRTQDFFPHNVKIMNKAINLIEKLKRRGP